jgi:dolichyl-diphosphooligosaccharide--protein glycosyltransferase
MVAVLWWVAELLGDGPAVVGHVLAWFPVVSAVITAAVVYLIAVRVTDDRRVGFAAVLVLALIPGHALRTSIGFADHHAFDYPWLAATALALVALVTFDGTDPRETQQWVWSVVLGVGVGAQVLAWEAGPLLVAPLALVVVGRTLTAVAAGRSPLSFGLPIATGLAVAAAFAGVVHVTAGWHAPVVAFTPALLLVGAVGAIGVAELVSRTTGEVRHLAIVDGVGVVVALLTLRVGLPEYWATLAGRLGVLFDNSGIAETFGLFSTSSFGFIFLLGFTLLLALPAMVVGVRRAVEDDRWLVATVYAWYFLLLASIQVAALGARRAVTHSRSGHARDAVSPVHLVR